MITAKLASRLGSYATNALNQTTEFAVSTILLDDWTKTQVCRSGSLITWANPNTKRLECFRTMAEAQREISLERAGLRCTFAHHTYKGQTVTIFASIFVQAPDEVMDSYRGDKGFLMGDMDWIAYFQIDGRWHSMDSIESIKDLFNLLIDAEEVGGEF
jgi:hypothetical protein